MGLKEYLSHGCWLVKKLHSCKRFAYKFAMNSLFEFDIAACCWPDAFLAIQLRVLVKWKKYPQMEINKFFANNNKFIRGGG